MHVEKFIYCMLTIPTVNTELFQLCFFGNSYVFFADTNSFFPVLCEMRRWDIYLFCRYNILLHICLSHLTPEAQMSIARLNSFSSGRKAEETYLLFVKCMRSLSTK